MSVDADPAAGDIEPAVSVVSNWRFRLPHVRLQPRTKVDPQPITSLYRRMLGGGRRDQGKDKQADGDDTHVSVNAGEPPLERGVQKLDFCVNFSMDNAVVTEQSVEKKKKKKKKDKVRSAWISFAGRIVAQMVGAIATVALGVMVLHRYTSTDTRGQAPELGYVAYAQQGYAQGHPPAASGGVQGQRPVVIVLSPGMLALHDADEPLWPADRSCAPASEAPATSAAHLDNGTFLPR